MPDTNIFIHFKRYEDIDWPKEVDAPAVRLIVPLVVIQELNSKSYSKWPRAKRVKAVLRSLASLHGEDADPQQPVAVPKRKDVTLQFLMDPGRYEPQPDKDGELISRVKHLTKMVGREHLLLVTGDLPMQLRARQQGVRCMRLRDDLRVPLDAESEDTL